MWSRFSPERGLLDSTTDAHDGSAGRELVHGRVRGSGQARMPHVWIGHQAFDLQPRGALQTGGHHHEAVLVEPPVAHAEAIEPGGLRSLRELDEVARWLLPADGRQVAKGKFHRAAPAPTADVSACTCSITSPMPRTVSA